MSRGMKSSQRDRCTLHKKHLPHFKAWLAAEPAWLIMQPTPHSYEVLHVMKVSRGGVGEHSFIYHNDHNDHLTVQSDLVPYMKRWLAQHKQEKKNGQV